MAPSRAPGILAQEKRLVEQLISGDRSAGEAFISGYGRLIAYCVRRAGIAPSDQDDVCQQVYVHLWEENCRRLSAWRGEAPLAAFLARLVSRLAWDHCRQNGAQTEALPETLAASALLGRATSPVEQAVEQEEVVRWQRDTLRKALSHLSVRDARLLILRHHDGLSYREIAETLGWTVNHVGVALMKAERRCRKVLESEFPELLS